MFTSFHKAFQNSESLRSVVWVLGLGLTHWGLGVEARGLGTVAEPWDWVFVIIRKSGLDADFYISGLGTETRGGWILGMVLTYPPIRYIRRYF